MNKIWVWSITAALAGFLFGFDTVVISGAERMLQELWGTSDVIHGAIVVGIALWGTVVGALFGGIPTSKYGRKRTLIGIGVLYTLSAIGSALANDPWTFAFFRFIGGLGVGASTVAAPAYISEIAPPEKRGKLVGLYQFNIVPGNPGRLRFEFFTQWHRRQCLALHDGRRGHSCPALHRLCTKYPNEPALATDEVQARRSTAHLCGHQSNGGF